MKYPPYSQMAADSHSIGKKRIRSENIQLRETGRKHTFCVRWCSSAYATQGANPCNQGYNKHAQHPRNAKYEVECRRIDHGCFFRFQP